MHGTPLATQGTKETKNFPRDGVGKMEPIQDADIRPLWSVSYPKRKESATFHALCLIVSAIIKTRAEAISPDGNFGDKLHQALNLLGVLEEEFYQFLKESDEKCL
jgi:hypothetical protein